MSLVHTYATLGKKMLVVLSRVQWDEQSQTTRVGLKLGMVPATS